LTQPSTQQSFGSAAGLTFTDFGYWNTPSGPANFFVTGTPTPVAQLPPLGANVSATYNGLYVESHSAGMLGDQQLSPGVDTGAMSVTANFGQRTLTSAFTSGILGAASSFLPAPINADGTYSVFNGNGSSLAKIQFTASGRFYGPSAPTQAPPETAGTLSGTIGSANMTGTFGAHR
jgi:hypothetical protein